VERLSSVSFLFSPNRGGQLIAWGSPASSLAAAPGDAAAVRVSRHLQTARRLRNPKFETDRHPFGFDQKRANLGRLLWFDIIGGLNNDNTCGGCHSPTNGFGDTQPMAIGIDNSLIVGTHPIRLRNQRRTPLAGRRGRSRRRQSRPLSDSSSPRTALPESQRCSSNRWSMPPSLA
jgi:hypothetical protein